MRAVVASILLWSATASARHHCSGDCRWWGDGLMFGFLDDAFVVEHVTMPASSTTGTAFSATSTAPFHAEQQPGSMWTLGYRTGVIWRDPDFIIGAEFAFGASVSAPNATAEVEGNPTVTSNGGEIFDVAAVIGPHHRFGSLDVGGLLVTGVRIFQTLPTLPDGFTTCTGGATGKGCYAFTQNAQPLVEVRGRIEEWIGSHVTLGVSAGIDVLHGGESFALELQIHLRPHDE
jgi:hypothetical protein